MAFTRCCSRPTANDAGAHHHASQRQPRCDGAVRLLEPSRPVERERLSPSLLRDAWLVAETEASLALAAWRSAPQSQKGKAYASYVVALEREAEAADLLAMRLAPAGA